MGTFIGGLASGIDSKTLIEGLINVERNPQRILNKKKLAMQGQVDIYNRISKALDALETAAAAMNTASNIAGRTVTVGDSTVFTATAGSTVTPGNHTLSITSLARSQRQVSQGYASAEALNFNTGTITISGLTNPITIAEGSNSLNGIAEAINSSGANVTASIINDGSGSPYRLVISGKDTKNYTVDFSGLTGAPASGTPYANPVLPGEGDPTYTKGVDAVFKLDGVDITKTSNVITDVIPGMTINLLKEGGSSNLAVAADNTAITGKINTFVSAYNDIVDMIGRQATYDAATKKGQALSGDSTLRNVMTDLQRMMTSPIDDPTAKFSALFEIGFKTDSKTGKISVDSTKLTDALNKDYNGVVNLFTKNNGVPDLDRDKYGKAEQFRITLEKLTHSYVGPGDSTNGLIATRIKGLNDSMTDIDNQIGRMELLLTRKEEALKKQFTAMESLVSSLNSQGTSLIQSLNRMIY